MVGRCLGNNDLQLHNDTSIYARELPTALSEILEPKSGQLNATKLLYELCGEYNRPFIIDIGAHVGISQLSLTYQKGVHGWLFEPHAGVCKVLEQNIALNGMANRFRVFQTALSNFPGRRILKSPHSDKDSGLSCIGQPNYAPYKEQYVNVMRLDDVVADNALDSLDIIRVDAEGSELFALIGATETINRYKPDLLLTLNWAKLNQLDVYINNATDYLELLGYKGHWLDAEEMLFRHPNRESVSKEKLFNRKPDTGSLKVALVKQRYDVFGPWRSEKYEPTNPFRLFEKWPSKYNMLEATHLFQADWFVLPFCHDSKLTRQKIDLHQQTFDDNMEVVSSVTDIPFDDYDVVISLDPILRPPHDGQVLYAYFQNEHHHNEYTQSIREPLAGYDLFLDHMMKAPSAVYDLPQSVAFPYPRDPFSIREICFGERGSDIWFDKRFVMMLTHGCEAFHRGAGYEATLAFLEKKFDSNITFRNLDFEDMTSWGDSLGYMRDMSRCAYYVNLIACGAGQGLCDAASIGLICFGSPKLPYHRVICHPSCLCNDLSELELKLSMVKKSADLQTEIRSWQDTALSDIMVKQPLRILEKAVSMKRQRNTALSFSYVRSSAIINELTVDDLPRDIARINSTKLKQRAQAEYERENYDEALHLCNQALWFVRADHELFFLKALANYALKDHRKALSSVSKCLEINSQFRPALTLQSVLLRDDSVEETLYKKCRERILYLIHNRFNGYNKEIEGQYLEQYNGILDEIFHDYMHQGDLNNQLLIQHHKIRLNSIAGI